MIPKGSRWRKRFSSSVQSPTRGAWWRSSIVFKQQRKAVGYLSEKGFRLFSLKLQKVGYERHEGLRVSREGEVAAFRRAFLGADGLRQNHVQIVEREGVFAVYAHTEPHTVRLLDHTISALDDRASFSGGSKMLRNDLEVVGCELLTYAEVLAENRRNKGKPCR